MVKKTRGKVNRFGLNFHFYLINNLNALRCVKLVAITFTYIRTFYTYYCVKSSNHRAKKILDNTKYIWYYKLCR